MHNGRFSLFKLIRVITKNQVPLAVAGWQNEQSEKHRKDDRTKEAGQDRVLQK